MTAQKLTELLFLCGIAPLPRSKVLTMFIECKGKEVTSRQVERKTDLRQPEVSLALSDFVEKKWITELKPKEQEGKGRPTKLYVLGVPSDVIYLSIAKGIEKDFKEKASLLEQLKQAMTPQEHQGEQVIPKQIQGKLL